jgi:hypothetical protein
VELPLPLTGHLLVELPLPLTSHPPDLPVPLRSHPLELRHLRLQNHPKV